MEGRRSIFSTKGDGEEIGYIEGAEAFNLSGQRRCRYDGQTGNLRDLGTGSIVGHVSLALLWQIISGTGIPNQFFCELMGGRLLEGRPWREGI